VNVVRAIQRLIGKIRGIDPIDADFDAEVHEHLHLLTERYVRQGMTQEDAAHKARRQFGSMTLLQEERHHMQTNPLIESLWRDCRHAGRMVRKDPAFAAVVVLTLGLSIGATTAIFSICNQVLLKPLPYTDADRVVMLWEQLPETGLMPVAPANFLDVVQQTHSFSAVAAISPFQSFTLVGAKEAVRLAGAGVSWNFFSLLQTPMAMGRSFLQQEDLPGHNRVAILSYATWVDYFGARPELVGTKVTFNDIAYDVVGILPRDFELVAKASDFQGRNRFDVWVPLALNATTPSRGTHPLRVFARLKPENDLGQAQADLDVVAANLARAYPADDKGRGIRAVPFREQVTADARPVLFTLFVAVGFVLAIACANVASLSLTRGAARHRETCLRLAIGASRGRIAQQFLIESVVLGLLGGAVGVGVAFLGIHVALPYLPADLPRSSGIPIDWRVLSFTGATSVATGIVFGLAPLFQTRLINASDSLTPGLRVAGGVHTELHRALVIAQMAIALMLLIGAGLMGKSLWALLHVSPGFRSDHVLTARFALPRLRYADAGKVAAFQRDLFDRVRRLPGVQSAGATSSLPLSGDDNGWAFFIEGRPLPPIGVFDVAKYRAVSDGYFEAMRTPIIAGRAFAPADSEDAPMVVMINESMARQYWRGQNPLGQRLRFGGPAWRTVIAVVGDVRHEGLDGEAKAEMYVPFGQAPNVESLPTIVVHTAIDPAAITSAVRAVVKATDASVPLDRVGTMDQLVSASVRQPRFRTFLLAVLSILALVMASIGIYGVTSYTVVQRTREFGIYLAVGATANDVLRLVLGRAVVLSALGVGIGLLGAFAMTRLIAKLLYGVTTLDAQTFAAVSLLLFAVAFVASYIPARRAASIDPMVALRYD
jgi:putative ABC transport system permease protein